MESLEFTDDELKVRAREARKLEALAGDAGEVMVASHYAGILRAIEKAAEARGIEV